MVSEFGRRFGRGVVSSGLVFCVLSCGTRAPLVTASGELLDCEQSAAPIQVASEEACMGEAAAIHWSTKPAARPSLAIEAESTVTGVLAVRNLEILTLRQGAKLSSLSLHTGVYDDPGNGWNGKPAGPFVMLNGERTCRVRPARFDLRELCFDSAHALRRVRMTFEESCDDAPGVVSGCVQADFDQKLGASLSAEGFHRVASAR